MIRMNLLWQIRAIVVFILILKGGREVLVESSICLHQAGCPEGGFTYSFHSLFYEAFLGIPYAFKPKRFEPAKPYRRNKEPYPARIPKNDCIQKNYLLTDRPITGDEDCLYLNLYRPADRASSAIPVLVYLFGGGFFTNTYLPNGTGPDYILDNDNIIIITVSYRLGPFGFLATDDGVIPGNLGLKDQIEALKWVFKYVDKFGGDRFRITLMGHSAGAVAAHMHMLSKLSRRLFYAIIAISGTANVPFAIDENPTQTARLTAKYCNISNWDTMNTHELKKALQGVDAKTLLNAGDHLKYWDIDNLVNYRPVVEADTPEAFITHHPQEYLRTGRYTPVPILFGRVPNEGGIRAVAIMESENLKRDFNHNFVDFLSKLVEYPAHFTDSQKTDKTTMLIKEYFKGIGHLYEDTKQNFLDLLTHRFFYHPLYNAVKMYVDVIDTNKYPVFFHNFAYPGPYSFADKFVNYDTRRIYGIIHGDDLFYFLTTKAYYQMYSINSNDARAVKMYIDDIIYFAHHREQKEYLERCNKTTFYETGSVCSYTEYVRGGGGEMIARFSTQFDTKRMQFWDDILRV